MDPEYAKRKKENLLQLIRRRGALAVAFSGGVDSAFLAAVAHEAVGARALAVTADSPIHPAGELEAARAFARSRGIRHAVFQSKEMDLPQFASNPADRCYHCKRHLLQTALEIASEKGIACVAHGANMDDFEDYRPGFRAAEELGVVAPLVEAALNKEEIRFLSKKMGLSTWNKLPTPCLATRIPYGTAVTLERLEKIGRAEAFLSELGYRALRVRHHGSVARIEMGRTDLERFLKEGPRETVVEKLRELGFDHVALDLEGYVSGKLNRSLKPE